jgi:hypothetical protein
MRQARQVKNVSENAGNAAAEERFAGQLNYRGPSRREAGGGSAEPPGDADSPRGAGNLSSVLDRPLPTQPSMSLTEVTALREPVFPGGSWGPAESGAGAPVAEHPLVGALLRELPPRGSAMPSQQWLDRWFDATRSVLELLYVQESPARPRPSR